MRRLLISLVALVVAIPPGTAVATHSAGLAPPYDFVHGTVHLDRAGYGAFDQHVAAMSGPSGEDPRGSFYVREVLEVFPRVLDFRGRVTCLNVEGNRATVGGVVTQTGEPSPAVGTGILMSVVDNGEPGDNDESVAFFLLSAPPTTCLPPAFGPESFNGGNYVVHDAEAPAVVPR